MQYEFYIAIVSETIASVSEKNCISISSTNYVMNLNVVKYEMLDVNRTVLGTSNANLGNTLEALRSLSETAQKIYDILVTEKQPMRSITISKKANMPVRTVRYNLSRLVEHDIVQRVPDMRDTRSNYYMLR